MGAEAGVEGRRDRPQVGPATGQPDSGETMMLRTSSWVGCGSSPVAAIASSTPGSRADRAGRGPEVGPRGQVHVAVAVLSGDLAQPVQGASRDRAADQPQPHQRAVVGRPRPEHAWAEITAVARGRHDSCSFREPWRQRSRAVRGGGSLTSPVDEHRLLREPRALG